MHGGVPGYYMLQAGRAAVAIVRRPRRGRGAASSGWPLTCRNSCPTAPVTPTTAMRGPFPVFAALTATTRALLARVPALRRTCRCESCILAVPAAAVWSPRGWEQGYQCIVKKERLQIIQIVCSSANRANGSLTVAVCRSTERPLLSVPLYTSCTDTRIQFT